MFSPSGSAVRVIAVSERYSDSECYKIKFHDGAEIVAGAGHLWRLRKKIRRRVSGSEIRRIEWQEVIVPTHELMNQTRGDVGVCEPIQYSVNQLEIHPYVLGVWLGDGHSAGGRVTNADKEVFDRIERLGWKLSRPNGLTRNVYGLMPLLRKCGVLNNKHLPNEYKTAAVQQRMELLRGLMDTDGHCNTRGTATFVNTNEVLANDVYELAVGLGLRPRIRRHEFNDGYQYWQVSFQSHQDRIAFHLGRKAERSINSSSHRDTRNIVSVSSVPSVPTKCIQVEGGLYLAGRELIPTHNSTIITFALTIQDILNDPETTIGIFSHTRPIAKAFLKQVKREFEANEFLKELFPDVLWQNPQKESPKWSEDEGIVVKRSGNPKESTIEAWGLVDGQPVSKHFKGLVFDDMVTQASITSPTMIDKTTDAWELALSLGSDGGFKRYVGTRYHFNDTYNVMMKRGSVVPRIYPCTDDGTETGEPVLMSRELIAEKRRDQGPYTFGTQMLLNPKGDSKQGFKEEWLKYYKNCDHSELNVYILVDPANEKKKNSDYTAMFVIGLGPDGKYRVLDIIRDRLNLTERWAALLKLHRKYKPLEVGYEKYGKDSDIQHFEAEMERINYSFDIRALGGATAKIDRIKRLVPLFENGNILLPETLHRTNWEKKAQDLVQVFIEEEYKPFPVPNHDDMLDALARIVDPNFITEWPELDEWEDDEHYNSTASDSAWLGM